MKIDSDVRIFAESWASDESLQLSELGREVLIPMLDQQLEESIKELYPNVGSVQVMPQYQWHSEVARNPGYRRNIFRVERLRKFSEGFYQEVFEAVWSSLSSEEQASYEYDQENDAEDQSCESEDGSL